MTLINNTCECVESGECSCVDTLCMCDCECYGCTTEVEAEESFCICGNEGCLCGNIEEDMQ